MSDGLRFLVILTAYDPAISATRTFYLTNGTGFITASTDTPAHTPFLPLLAQPLDVTRRVQGLQGERVVPTLGDITVHNNDGALDGWMDYAWDGRACVVRVGPATQGAYPSAYPVTFTGTIDRVDVGDTITIRLRDEVTALDAPLQGTLYDGDNVLPDGLEGVEDLEGAPKPLVYGTVKNIPLVAVNTSKLIHQISDGAIQSVEDVYDSGLRLGTYAPVDFSETSASHGGHCAASDGGTIVAGGRSGGNPVIKTTTDGATWNTIGSLPFISSGIVVGMAYDAVADRFCCVTNNATGEIATSDDAGATWTIRTAAAAVSFNRLRYCTKRSLWIAVGDGGAIHTSSDAVTWTAQTSGTAEDLHDVAVNGPLLLAVGANGATTTSADGTTWSALTAGTANRLAAFWHDGIYYLTGSSVSEVYRSQDAISFTVCTSYTQTGIPSVVDFAAAGDWVVVLYRVGNSRFITSATRDRGASWITTNQLSTTTTAFALVAHDDRFYVLSGLDGADTQRTCRSGAPSAYADLTELEDDDLAPLPGSYKWVSNAAGSYVRLGAPPVGLVTADVSQGANAAARTAGQLIVAVLTKAGYTSSDYSTSDITALDTAENGVCGLYVAQGETVAECIDRLARTVGAWWGVDADGVIRIQQLTAPSGTATFTVDEEDVAVRSLTRLASSDPLRGLPSHQTTLRYAKHWTVQTSGVAAGVSAARRAELAREWREVVSSSPSVLTTHLLAQATVEETCFAEQADAQGEATRRQALRGTMRDAFTVTVPLADFAYVELGAVGTLTHSRYGLDAGVTVKCLGVALDAAARRITLTLWR